MKKENKRLCWDVIPGFRVAACCATCDCSWPNENVRKHEEWIKKEGLLHMPGHEYPYPLWCMKYEAETCKYGDCPGWEED